jgi:hypothetical protein
VAPAQPLKVTFLSLALNNLTEQCEAVYRGK